MSNNETNNTNVPNHIESLSSELYGKSDQPLGQQLKELRKAAGLSGEELAEQLQFSQSKISRIETGRLIPSSNDVEKIAQAVQASSSQASNLIKKSEMLTTQARTWRNLRGYGLPHWQAQVKQMEVRARQIRSWQPTLIPGLLQTAEYIRHVLNLATLEEADEQEVATAMSRRLERQQALFDQSKKMTFIIYEAALRVSICPEIVMRAQIDRLMSLATLPNLQIGIIPFRAELHTTPSNGFVIFDSEAVMIETSSAEFALNDEKDVDLYSRKFQRLYESALLGIDATAFLREFQV